MINDLLPYLHRLDKSIDIRTIVKENRLGQDPVVLGHPWYRIVEKMVDEYTKKNYLWSTTVYKNHIETMEENATTNNENFQKHEDAENNVSTASISIHMPAEDFGRPTTLYGENRTNNLPPYSSSPLFELSNEQLEILKKFPPNNRVFGMGCNNVCYTISI